MTDAAWYDFSQHDLSSEKSWENKSEFLEANAEKRSAKGRARKNYALKNGFSFLLLFSFHIKKKWLANRNLSSSKVLDQILDLEAVL